MLQVKKF